MTLIYAFANRWSTNISARVLSEFQSQITNKNYFFHKIYGHPKAFFHTHIYGKIYDSIIGLGDLYGNFNHLKLETMAKNQYGYKPISTNSPYKISLNTGPLVYRPGIVISQDMGNYNCNWLAYQTQAYLNSKHLATSHLFFHLPKKLPPTLLSTQIIQFLKD